MERGGMCYRMSEFNGIAVLNVGVKGPRMIRKLRVVKKDVESMEGKICQVTAQRI